jgi:hypothetical protein
VSDRKRPALRERLGQHKKKLTALAILLVAPTAAHIGIALSTRIEPPAIAPVAGEPTLSADGDLRVLGPRTRATAGASSRCASPARRR